MPIVTKLLLSNMAEMIVLFYSMAIDLLFLLLTLIFTFGAVL